MSIARVLIVCALTASAVLVRAPHAVAAPSQSASVPPKSTMEPVESAAAIETASSQPSRRFQKPALALSVVAGGTFQLLIQTPMLLGGGELRLGALTRRVEVTARLRLQAGRTLGGLLLLEPSFALGLLFPVDSRVRIGTELVIPPFLHSLSVRYVTKPEWKFALLGGASIETSIDILKQPANRALFWSGTVGVDLTSISPGNGNNQPRGQLGPRLWTGIGYRL